MFLSGDDADDHGHCEGTACAALYPQAMSFVYNNSATSGNKIAAVGVNSGQACDSFKSWNNAGPGAAVEFLTTSAEIQNMDLTPSGPFRMIYIPSNDDNTLSGGFTASQLTALNNRQSDIVDFVNNQGGGVMALTQARDSHQYGWMPVALSTQDKSHVGDDIFPTADMTTIASVTSSDLDHGCCYHTIFTGPSGFSGMEVLAFHDHNGNQTFDGRSTDDVMILGGVQVTIQGSIDLAPDSDSKFVGEQHTVTATAKDGDPLAPAQGVTVSFKVTAGPNVGTSGTATTDSKGEASFTYTGSGGTGTDRIVAQFTDNAGNTQTSDTVKAIWKPKPNQPPMVTCENIDRELGDDGNVIIPSQDVIESSSDPDGDPLTSSVTPNQFTCADTGDNPVTVTVTDDDGASASCQAIVTVEDNTPPDITCPQNLRITTRDPNGVSVSNSEIQDFLSNANATDNCPNVSISHSPLPSSFPVGTTAVNFTATDASGNQDTCTATVTVVLNVAFDIKPGSCPNPLDTHAGKGVLPVAIAGTDNLDVTILDPSSVEILGVKPLRGNIEDVTRPHEPFLLSNDPDCSECTEEGPDGIEDLTLKFDKEEIINALEAARTLEDGDCERLRVTGELIGGGLFQGDDVVRIEEGPVIIDSPRSGGGGGRP